jgi:hypothetical protein
VKPPEKARRLPEGKKVSGVFSGADGPLWLKIECGCDAAVGYLRRIVQQA